jgi:hypothetical protein
MATERGSARLLRERGQITHDDAIKKIAELSEAEQIKLVDWMTKGTPHIDGFQGTFHAGVDKAGSLITDLLQTGIVGHVRVFPIGVPVIDELRVQFDTEQQG